MTKQEKIEILFNIITERANDGEVNNNEIKTEEEKLLLLEKIIKKDLSQQKQKELLKYSDQAGLLYITSLDYNIKFTIEFMLDFFVNDKN